LFEVLRMPFEVLAYFLVVNFVFITRFETFVKSCQVWELSFY
jgi:hypothetical protein